MSMHVVYKRCICLACLHMYICIKVGYISIHCTWVLKLGWSYVSSWSAEFSLHNSLGVGIFIFTLTVPQKHDVLVLYIRIYWATVDSCYWLVYGSKRSLLRKNTHALDAGSSVLCGWSLIHFSRRAAQLKLKTSRPHIFTVALQLSTFTFVLPFGHPLLLGK
jgi:hypothetical protein